MSLRKVYIVVFVLLIIATGILRHQVALLYSVPINYLLSLFGIDHTDLIHKLSFLAKDGSADHGLGVFFYYPTYLLLHFSLIHNLFYDNMKLKMKLIYSLSIIIIGLAGLTVFFKAYGMIDFYNVSFRYFELVAARPLILFLIEGGGMIYQQVEDSNLEGNEDK